MMIAVRTKGIASFGVAAILYFTSQANAALLPRYGVFAYSNVCTEQQSGDAAGYRLILLRFGDGDRVLFDWSEGPLYSAEAYKVAVDPSGTHISFMVQIPGTTEPVYASSYSGEISADAVTINGSHIRRLYDFAQKRGNCSASK